MQASSNICLKSLEGHSELYILHEGSSKGLLSSANRWLKFLIQPATETLKLQKCKGIKACSWEVGRRTVPLKRYVPNISLSPKKQRPSMPLTSQSWYLQAHNVFCVNLPAAGWLKE